MGWCSVLSHTDWHSPAVEAQGTFDACPNKIFLLQSSHTRNTSDKFLFGSLHKTYLPSCCCINFSTPCIGQMLIATDVQCGIVTEKQSLPGNCLPTSCAGTVAEVSSSFVSCGHCLQ